MGRVPCRQWSGMGSRTPAFSTNAGSSGSSGRLATRQRSSSSSCRSAAASIAFGFVAMMSTCSHAQVNDHSAAAAKLLAATSSGSSGRSSGDGQLLVTSAKCRPTVKRNSHRRDESVWSRRAARVGSVNWVLFSDENGLSVCLPVKDSELFNYRSLYTSWTGLSERMKKRVLTPMR